MADDFAGVSHGKRPMSADQPGKVDAVEELHHQEMLAVRFPGIMGTNEVGMVELSYGLHLPLIAGDACGSRSRPAGRTLIATGRFNRVCIALYTVPIPPRPICSTISYWPSRAGSGSRGNVGLRFAPDDAADLLGFSDLLLKLRVHR